MKTIPFLLAAVIVLSVSTDSYGQSTWSNSHEQPQQVFFPDLYPIDWRADRPQRNDTLNRRNRDLAYTISVHPYHLMKSGLKIDLEKKLDKPGKWLQLGLMGYITPRRSDPEHYGWDNLLSGWDYCFDRLIGGGFSIAHKTMLGHTGFHYNYGFLYNFYHVDYQMYRYLPFTENGLPMVEYKNVDANTNFHQPAVFVNIGKHMALGKHVFLDAFMGMGYMYTFYSDKAQPYDGYLEYGYRGMYFNAGLRIGVVWGKKNR